jgi:hypothetical protein
LINADAPVLLEPGGPATRMWAAADEPPGGPLAVGSVVPPVPDEAPAVGEPAGGAALADAAGVGVSPGVGGGAVTAGVGAGGGGVGTGVGFGADDVTVTAPGATDVSTTVRSPAPDPLTASKW